MTNCDLLHEQGFPTHTLFSLLPCFGKTLVATTAGFVHSQLIPDQTSNLASTAEQTDSSIANSKRKYSSYHNDISSQYDHSHTKASKLSE